MNTSSYSSIDVVEVGADHFIGMIYAYERQYNMPWDQFFRKFNAGVLDRGNSDFGVWAYLCREFFEYLSGYGPPGAECNDVFDYEPPSGACSILGQPYDRRSIRPGNRSVHSGLLAPRSSAEGYSANNVPR